MLQTLLLSKARKYVGKKLHATSLLCIRAHAQILPKP